jgi:hypothetical protein
MSKTTVKLEIGFLQQFSEWDLRKKIATISEVE